MKGNMNELEKALNRFAEAFDDAYSALENEVQGSWSEKRDALKAALENNASLENFLEMIAWFDEEN
jgi:F0F1-type ATP synthase delta subunit